MCCQRQGAWEGSLVEGQAGEGELTKLLDGTVSTPGQLQSHVHTAALVQDPAVGLEGDTRAGRFRDDGHQLGQRPVSRTGLSTEPLRAQLSTQPWTTRE